MAQSVDTVMHQLSFCRGRRISVISSSDNRFEGWLKDVSPEVQTISLEKVRFCGTESRRPDKPVAARREIYDLIKLHRSQAKEIFVHVGRVPETGLNSAVGETCDAVIPILWATAHLGNQEIHATPSDPLPTANPTVSDEGALLDIPLALQLLSEALQHADKPHMTFISRSTLVRYEGTLKGLDSDQGLVFLTNVRSLGTEDRRGMKSVAPRAKPYLSDQTVKLHQIQNIRIHVEMGVDVLEDAAVIADESSAGIIELDAGCPLTGQTRQPLHASGNAEPAQNDSGQDDGGSQLSSQPVNTLRQDCLLHKPAVRKARRNSRALANGPASAKTVCVDDAAEASSPEPSSSTSDDSDYAGSHRPASLNADDQQAKKVFVYNTRKRMASITPGIQSSDTVKKGKNNGSSERRSGRQPCAQNPVDTSDAVRSAGEAGSIGSLIPEAMQPVDSARDQIFEESKKRLHELQASIRKRIDSAYNFGNSDHRRFQPEDPILAFCDGVFYEASIVQHRRALPIPRILGVENPTVMTCIVHYLGWSKKNDEEHMEIDLISQRVDTADDAADMLFAHEWNTWLRMQRGVRRLGPGSWRLLDTDFARLEQYCQNNGGMDVSFAEYSGRRQAEAALASLDSNGQSNV